MCLDPLPLLHYFDLKPHERVTRNARTPQICSPLPLRVPGNSPVDAGADGLPLNLSENDTHLRLGRDGIIITEGRYLRTGVRKHHPFSPFRTIVARCPRDFEMEDSKLADTGDTRGTGMTAMSTQQAFECLLNADRSPPVAKINKVLLRILHRDIIALAEIMRSSLEDLRMQMVKVSIPQIKRQTLSWRTTLGIFHLEIQGLSDGLPSLRDFLYRDEQGEIKVPKDAEKLTNSIIAELRDTNEQVDRAYNALRTELQMLDTRQSVEQAESVAKLTELAFIFIPLTFATGIFSMQITEIQKTPPSARVFVGVAIAFVCSAYLARLAIRSELLHEPTQNFIQQARDHADIPESDSISTRQLLKFIFYTIFQEYLPRLFGYSVRYIAVGVLLVLLLLPLIFFWRRGFDAGYTAAVSITITMIYLLSWWVILDKRRFASLVKWKIQRGPRRWTRRRLPNRHPQEP